VSFAQRSSGRSHRSENEGTAAERISIKIPASPEYIQVVRLVAAGLAARLSFTLEDIEDLKIAVDELSAYITGAHGRSGTLAVSFTLHDARIQIRGSGKYTVAYDVRTDLTEFSRMILETVTDSAELSASDGMPAFSIVKSRSSG
jgi:serine/threonine-protein kinase RsbW